VAPPLVQCNFHLSITSCYTQHLIPFFSSTLLTLLQVHPDAQLPNACPPLASLRPWPHFAGDTIWSAFGLFSFICLVPAEDVTMVTAQQQSLALSALRVSTSTLQLNVPIFAPIGAVPGQSLSGFSRVLGNDGMEALVSMEIDNLDEEEAAGVDSMAPLTYIGECTRAVLRPHLRANFTDNSMVTFVSEYILANFDAPQQVWKKVGGHARGSFFVLPFGPAIDPIDSFHVTLVWPLVPLFAALQQELLKGPTAKALAASSAKWIVCSVRLKPDIESPLACALRFLFENLSDVRRCASIADLLAADSVTLFLQGSKSSSGSKTFVKALDDMFKPQPPTMQYEAGLMQGLRSLGCKASPPSSLFALFCRHAMFLCQVSDVGRLWAEFVRELRWYWENVDQLPAVCNQPPDHSTGYIEQKLCMLQVYAAPASCAFTTSTLDCSNAMCAAVVHPSHSHCTAAKEQRSWHKFDQDHQAASI
jgi:hypothetical protein